MTDLYGPLDKVKLLAKEEFSKVQTIQDLEQVRQKFLSKKGLLAEQYKTLASLDPKDKAEFGKALNLLQNDLTQSFKTKDQVLKQEQYLAKIAGERSDLTLPARASYLAKTHVISETVSQLAKIFGKMGFKLATGPDIDDDFHNFQALNFPSDHPARDMHDTFFIDKKDDKDNNLLLRTHTSTVQIRSMLKEGAPISIIAPGRCYRCDYDITHTPMFHQIEGLHVDKNVSMADLKGCLYQFAKEYFEVEDLALKFRSSFFPFTEPSAEVDIGCKMSSDIIKLGSCDSKDLDWLEILGCGMVDPNVLENCGIDPMVYSGFAFGMGIERIAMLKYGMPDLRSFFKGDIRWLEHYGFSN